MCARLKKHLEEEIITQSYKEEDDRGLEILGRRGVE